MICSICNKDFNSSNIKMHYNKCNYINENSSDIIHDYTVNLLTAREIEIKYKINYVLLKRFLQSQSISIRNISHAMKVSQKPKSKHTQETKTKLSATRTKYLIENPDKHPWKLNSKFKSVPCEQLKTILRDRKISFIEEYMPGINGRLYSIDIAFPDKKIGLEINGNQHYNSDGTLKDYYKTRHNIICSDGWKLYEYHYSLVYDNKFITDLVSTLQSTFDLGLVNYSFYIKPKKLLSILKVLKPTVNTKPKYIKKLKRAIDLCIDGCGSIVHVKGDRCRSCYNLHARKIIRPSYDQLKSDLQSSNYCAIGRKYGVSDNAVRKWLKNYRKVLTI